MSGRPKSVDPASKMISVRFSPEELELLNECRVIDRNGVKVEMPLAPFIRQLALGQCKKMKGGD